MAFEKSLELAPFTKISRHIKPLRPPNPDKAQAEIKFELLLDDLIDASPTVGQIYSDSFDLRLAQVRSKIEY